MFPRSGLVLPRPLKQTHKIKTIYRCSDPRSVAHRSAEKNFCQLRSSHFPIKMSRGIVKYVPGTRDPRLQLAALGARAAVRYGPGIARAGVKFVKKAYNASKTQTPSNVKTYAPTTYQRDVKTTYSRKRAPKRVRRRARKSMQMFQKNMSNLLGCKRLVLNDYQSNIGVINRQRMTTLMFMDFNDIQKAFSLYGQDGVPLDLNYNFTTQNATELLFRNIRMEVELSSAANDLQFIDLYYFYPRKDLNFIPSEAWFNASNFGEQDGRNAGSFTAAGTITNSTTISINELGMTPFDYPAFTENFIIYKTRRINLSAGQSISFELKARPGNQSSKDWLGVTQRKNITSGVIIISGGTATGTGTSAPGFNIHRQVWSTMYRQGGKGATSKTYVGSGL